MAGKNRISLEILTLFNQIGYRDYVQVLSERDAIQIKDFPNLQISDTHWLDVCHCFKNGKFNPNHVLEKFVDYSGLEVDDLHDKVLQLVQQDITYWTHVSNVVLPMKALDFDTWLAMMKIPICAVDELMLFVLCKIHDRHAMVFTNSKLWTTVKENSYSSLEELYTICDVCLVYLGQDLYGELRCLFDNNSTSHEVNIFPAVFKTVMAGKTLSSIPSLTKLCQEVLKKVGTEQRLVTSCNLSLKPEMEGFLRDHPHLLTALGLSHKASNVQLNSASPEEVTPQPDLDIVHTPQTAEEPVLSQSTNNSDSTSHKTNPESCSEDIADIDDQKEQNENPVEKTVTVDGKNINDEIPIDLLKALALERVVHMDVSKDEVDSYKIDTSHEDTHPSDTHGLYFEKVGGRVLRPRKRQYHINRSRRDSTSRMFYRDQCEETTWHKTRRNTSKPQSGPSEECIQSSRYPQRNHNPPKYTYPVVQKQLKRDEKHDVTESDSRSSDNAEPLNQSDELPSKHDTDTDAMIPVSEPQDTTNDVAPKGSLKTKFYGLKIPGNGTKTKRKRKRNYQCQQCPQSYPNQSLLNNHYKAEHPPVTCPKCSLSFNMPSTLAGHLYVHSELKFTCKECKHKKIKSHFCVKPGCGKGFFNVYALKKHAKIHDKKIWNCLQCQYTLLDE